MIVVEFFLLKDEEVDEIEELDLHGNDLFDLIAAIAHSKYWANERWFVEDKALVEMAQAVDAVFEKYKAKRLSKSQYEQEE